MREFTSLRASPTVSVELKFPVELNSFSENEFNLTQDLKSMETVGDARRLGFTVCCVIFIYVEHLH